MATGTGKTLTGLSAVVRLYQHVRKGLAIFIVCPYQHLVSQWVEDIESFNIKPVICHSASPQKHWACQVKGCMYGIRIWCIGLYVWDFHQCNLFIKKGSKHNRRCKG